jgi:hypothetical protein
MSVPHQVLKADQKQKSMQNEWQQGRDPHTIFLIPYFAFVDHIYDFGFFSILLEDDEMISLHPANGAPISHLLYRKSEIENN